MISPRPVTMTVAIVACGVGFAAIANVIDSRDPRFRGRTAAWWVWKRTWRRKAVGCREYRSVIEEVVGRERMRRGKGGVVRRRKG